MASNQLPFAGMILLLAFIVAAFLYGCATAVPKELDDLQTAIQNCILSGGHAHLGPGGTVICAE